MMIVEKKSGEASSKISGREVKFVHNCVSSSSGKNQYRLRKSKQSSLTAKLAGISCQRALFLDI